MFKGDDLRHGNDVVKRVVSSHFDLDKQTVLQYLSVDNQICSPCVTDRCYGLHINRREKKHLKAKLHETNLDIWGHSRNKKGPILEAKKYGKYCNRERWHGIFSAFNS